MRIFGFWSFGKLRLAYFFGGVLLIRILLFRATILGPPIFGNSHLVEGLGFVLSGFGFKRIWRLWLGFGFEDFTPNPKP